MTIGPDLEPDDSERLPRRFARTYSTQDGRDGWERVEDYRRFRAYAAEHPDMGSTALSTALEMPRGRIRSWLEGGRPDPVRGLDVAAPRGWLTPDWSTDTAQAMNVLVAWLFSGGSVAAESYVPFFTVEAGPTEQTLARMFEAVGIEYREENAGDAMRAREWRPDTHAPVLGRALYAWGAPTGRKNEESQLSLPAYLMEAPEQVRLNFARTYVLNRGHVRDDRPDLPVQLSEARPESFRKQLLALFRSLVDDNQGIVLSGDEMMYVDARASEELFFPPDLP